MNEKIGLTELFKARLGDNFEVGQRLVDIRIEARSMAKYAEKQVAENGEFAKLYAEQVADLLNDIASVANNAVVKLCSNSTKEKQ